MKHTLSLLLALALLLCCATVLTSCKDKDDSKKDTFDLQTALAGQTEGSVAVVMDIKKYGKIVVELYPDVAPITVENFLSLVDAGFYDGLTFHRLSPGFMAQGGDPNGDGTGGSETTIKGEFSANGVTNNLKHTRGVISMARSTAYNSASCQFFICVADASHLDGSYAAFGKVIYGMETVDAMMSYVTKNPSVFTTANSYYYSNGAVKAAYQPVINSITRAVPVSE